MHPRKFRLAVLATAAAALVLPAPSYASPIFSPGDFIIAIDGTNESRSQENPPNEGVVKAIDGSPSPANPATFTKYLNFGLAGTGFIVTPAAASTVQSFLITSGNDGPGRDPSKYVLMGTNDPITSANNSNGLAENWSLISQGTFVPPDTGGPTNNGRNAPYPLVSFSNATSYASYKMFFPRLRNMDSNGVIGGGNIMQIDEVQFYSDQAATNALLAPTNDIRAIDNPSSDSSYPTTERPLEAIDGIRTSSSKYLNFAREGSGLIIKPNSGSSIVRSFQMFAANDTEGRDPTLYQIFGTNDPITSQDNSEGTAENWTLITSGTYDMPSARNTATTEVPGPIVYFDNAISYAAYKIIFLDNKGPDGGGVNSIQVSEIVFDTVPEPTTLSVVLGAALLALARRRSLG